MSLPTLEYGDLAYAERAMAIELGHPGQREAFLAMHSTDVQAVPGSGKTTLLAAKLVALARKWGKRRGGVCVLSHTNVAHREVGSRLARVSGAGHLLHAPHFVGTFQQFAHRFLALPALRSRGIETPRIDDDSFAIHGAIAATFTKYRTARSYFENRRPDRPGGGAVAFQGVEYLDADFTLGIGGKPLSLGKETASYAELFQFKAAASKRGLFRFRDMFALAEYQLRKHPGLAELLRIRFPLVFLDEVQDTEEHQARLLKAIFDETTIVQRFGDINQKIYSGASADGGAVAFPAGGCLELNQSKRFGAAIAGVVSKLSLAHPVEIVGLAPEFECAPALFLFDDASIARVIPSFASWTLVSLPASARAAPVVKAVGLRVRSPEDDDEPPRAVGDYWSEYVGGAPGASDRSPTLFDYVCAARTEFQSGAFTGPAIRLLRLGVEQALLEAARHLGRVDGPVLKERDLREKHRPRWLDYRRALRAVLQEPKLEKGGWSAFCGSILDPYAVGDGAEVVAKARAGAAWQEDAVRPAEASIRTTARPCYEYTEPGLGVLRVEVTSIHAVKGETHDATLVLETHRYKHDLQSLLPLVAGTAGERVRRLQAKQPGIQMLERARSIFVAASRPRHLLAFAMEADHAGATELDALKAAGWHVVDLRAAGT